MTKLITEQKEFDKALESITSRGNKLANDIQVAALSAIAHCAEHKNPVWINRLYLAMPNGTRRAALSEWFLAFGTVSANTDAGTKKDMPFCNDKTKADGFDLEAAAETPWYEMKKEPDPDQVFDLHKAVAALIAKASKPGVKLANPKQADELKMLKAAFIK